METENTNITNLNTNINDENILAAKLNGDFSELDLKRANLIINTFTKKVEEVAPVRFGSSRDEKNSALKIRELYNKTLGVPAKMEPFTVHPLAGRFGIPILGVIYAIALLFYILGVLINKPVHNVFLVFAMLISINMFLMFVVQSYMNKNTFNFLFPKQTSYNVMTTVEAEKGAEFTLVLGGHYDSDMDRADAFMFMRDKNLPLWLSKTIKTMALLSVPTLLAFALIAMLLPKSNMAIKAFLFLFPVIFSGISIFYLTTYFSYSRKNSKRGRAGLTASGMALAVVDYLRQHGEKVPDNCQIILASFGCKECGAKGSEQFILEHWNRDSMLINPNVINFESVKPKGTKVIFGEKQQRLAYDRNLSNVVFNSFKDDMLNPTYENNKIMFTDAAPFAYRKIPATTIRLNAEHTGEDLQFDEAFMSAANAVVKTLEFLNNERARIIEKEKNAASI